MTERTLDLLVDLARLLRKYGPHEFEQLGVLFCSGEFAETLASILSESARVAGSVGVGTSRVWDQSGLKRLIEELSAGQPEKRQLLEEAGIVLGRARRLRDLGWLSEQAGLADLKSSTRNQAAKELLRSMAGLPFERLRHVVALLSAATRRSSTLDGWTDIILNETGREKG